MLKSLIVVVATFALSAHGLPKGENKNLQSCWSTGTHFVDFETPKVTCSGLHNGAKFVGNVAHAHANANSKCCAKPGIWKY
jgi:hypothetical protein